MGRDQEVSGGAGAGLIFQEETKYTPEKLKGHFLDWDTFPPTYKDYAEPLAVVELPEPHLPSDANLWQALRQRRSRRTYASDRLLPRAVLSTLLWATQGLTARYGGTYFRTAPSAGGLYPVETYVLVRAVEGLDPGIYHFRPHRFDLECLKRGEFARSMARVALGQDIVSSAQVTFIWSAVLARGKWKYRERAYRYIYIDAGHIGQNLYLAAEALGLGACTIGAFFDDDANRIIDLDGKEETIIYMGCVGYPTKESI